MTAIITLQEAVSARISASRISTTLDEFLGTIGLQRAVARMAADVSQHVDEATFCAVVKSLIESYRWELPAASDAYWALFGDDFAHEFAQYRTSNAWVDRHAAVAEDAQRAAVRRVGEGEEVSRNLIVEFCLLLGNRAAWRRFVKFAQAEACGLDAAFDRWYPCSRARFLIEDEAGRRVMKRLLDALEALPDEAAAYELFEVVERFPERREAVFSALSLGDASTPFEVQFARAAGLKTGVFDLTRLIAAALCPAENLSTPQREAFIRMCRTCGIQVG